MSELAQQVEGIPLFADISPAARTRLLRHTVVEEAEPGRVLIEEGSTVGAEMYVILSGEVDVLKRDRTGGEILLATLGRGAFFGEMSLFEEERRSATVRVRTPARVLVITRDALDRIMASTPRAANRLLLIFIQTLSHRLRQANERLAALTG